MPIELNVDAGLQDETPLDLTDDQRAVALRALQKLLQVAHHLSDRVGSLPTVSDRMACCGLLEHHFAELATALGHDSDVAREVEQRSADLRRANQEICRLEALRGSQRGLDGVPELLTAMGERLRTVWEELGFGLVYDVHGRGERSGGFSATHSYLWYDATLVPMLRSVGGSYSLTPVSDQQTEEAFLARMAAELDLHVEHRRQDAQLLDTERNRAWLISRLQAHFPSLSVRGWELWNGRGKPTVIRSLSVHIDDVRDLLRPEEADGY